MERFEIHDDICGHVIRYSAGAGAFGFARGHQQRHGDDGVTVMVYDRMARRGRPNLFTVDRMPLASRAWVD